jgi:SOS-response transcriptional repressor LexA
MKPRLKSNYEVFSFIEDYCHLHKMPPTVREIQDGLKVGSTRTILRYLHELERLKYIRRWPGARGMALIRTRNEVPVPKIFCMSTEDTIGKWDKPCELPVKVIHDNGLGVETFQCERGHQWDWIDRER